MTKKKELDVVFLLDRSGSMQGSETDTIGGYNSYLEKQRKNKFNTKITTILFDDQYEVLHNRLNIKDVNNLTYYTLTSSLASVATSGSYSDLSNKPDLSIYAQTSNLGTAAALDTGTSQGDIPVLGTNGKLPSSVVPASAITETYVESSQADMLALTAQVGDVCVRTDLNKSFILNRHREVKRKDRSQAAVGNDIDCAIV